jgi:TM2 domain-containing membrane protein YozV
MTDRADRPELGPEFERATPPDSPPGWGSSQSSGTSPLGWQPGPVYGTPGTGPGYEQASAQPPQPQYQQPQYQQPQYQPQYVAGYPGTYVQQSGKSKSAAGLLELLPSFFGFCGIGRLYLGHTATGLIQLLGMFVAMVLAAVVIGLPFMVAIWIWNLVDAIQMFSGNVADSHGRPLRD